MHNNALSAKTRFWKKEYILLYFFGSIELLLIITKPKCVPLGQWSEGKQKQNWSHFGRSLLDMMTGIMHGSCLEDDYYEFTTKF